MAINEVNKSIINSIWDQYSLELMEWMKDYKQPFMLSYNDHERDVERVKLNISDITKEMFLHAVKRFHDSKYDEDAAIQEVNNLLTS